jgi:uncharacterized protein YdeI (YjbR/CyaY-like superfamily)
MSDPEIPTELSAALARDERARSAFDALSPSHRREHIKYVAEGKRQETRERRAKQTVEGLAR